MTSDLDKGRRHYARQEWFDAFRTLRRAQDASPLDPADLERLVWSAGLIGDDKEFLAALECAYNDSLESGDHRRAARSGFWIGFRYMGVGSSSQASAWLNRAEQQLGHVRGDCAERGYLLLPDVYRCLANGDYADAESIAGQAARTGDQCGDRDLAVLALNLQGRALLRQHKMSSGLALLDQAMLSVTSGEVSPMVAGIVYCNVIASCNQVLAVDRAREWTAVLAQWIGQQPQLVNFTGTCLVHRSEVLQLAGRWNDALEEIRPVCDGQHDDKDPEVIADACYQQGELLRLTGSFRKAEAAYRRANRHGRDPQPGLALLRLAEGKLEEAAGAIERVLVTTRPSWMRARLLPACFDIMLAAGRIDSAREAADELADIASEFGTDFLRAIAARTRGAIQLVDGNPEEAARSLQFAFSVWNRVGAPFLTANIRLLLARAYRNLGDHDSADVEIEAARETYARLGARKNLEELASADRQSARSGLSPREIDVLKLLASGKTNKAIANRLGISERTVDRHVSNIFVKLDVPSRAAATAEAYRKKLL